jgi:hypothetical protein
VPGFGRASGSAARERYLSGREVSVMSGDEWEKAGREAEEILRRLNG